MHLPLLRHLLRRTERVVPCAVRPSPDRAGRIGPRRRCFFSRGPTLSKGRRICRGGHIATVRNATVYSSSSSRTRLKTLVRYRNYLFSFSLAVSFQGEPPQRTTYTAYTHTKGIGDRLFPPWNFSRFYVVGPIEHLQELLGNPWRQYCKIISSLWQKRKHLRRQRSRHRSWIHCPTLLRQDRHPPNRKPTFPKSKKQSVDLPPTRE